MRGRKTSVMRFKHSKSKPTHRTYSECTHTHTEYAGDQCKFFSFEVLLADCGNMFNEQKKSTKKVFSFSDTCVMVMCVKNFLVPNNFFDSKRHLIAAFWFSFLILSARSSHSPRADLSDDQSGLFSVPITY